MKNKRNKILILLIFIIVVGSAAAGVGYKPFHLNLLSAIFAAQQALLNLQDKLANFYYADKSGKVSSEDLQKKVIEPIADRAMEEENGKLEGESDEEYQLRVATLYRAMESNVRAFTEAETKVKGKTKRPEVYTWADIEPRRSTVADVDPGAELDGQDQSLAMFLKIATHPRNLLIYSSYYVNVKLPQFDDNGTKITQGAINVQTWKDPSANGGFFWSESSNLIYVGEDHCLELDGGSASSYVTLNWCTLDSPKQMWRRIVKKYSQTNGGAVAVAYESLAYPGKCMGSTAPGSTLTSLYAYDCKYANSDLYPNVIFSYESDVYLPPLETTTFKYGRRTGEFEAQHTSFSCIQKLVAAEQNSKTDNSQVCDNSSSKSLSRQGRATNDNQDVNRINGQGPFKVYLRTGGGSTQFLLDRHYYMGTKAIAPLLPGQWRSYVMNIGQGSFTVVDGYAWPHPVIIDMGSATKITPAGDVKKHAVELLKFMNWMMQTGQSIRIKMDQSEVSSTHYVRNPILIISHGDFDHYSLLEFMFKSSGDDPSLTKLPQPFAVYIGGSLESFKTKSTSADAPSVKTRTWLTELARVNSGTLFYENINFSVGPTNSSGPEKLFATDNRGTEVQIDAAIPLVLPVPTSNTQTVSLEDRTDRPWLYFLESNPTAKGKNSKNRQSLIVSVADGFYSITAPGDGDKENEANASSRAAKFGIRNLMGLVLSSHHGAKTQGSNSPQFYQEFNPSSVIFSAGNSNSYGHPTYEAYKAIKDNSGQLLCLSADGRGNKNFVQCNTDPAHEGYIGEERTTFPKGGQAVFLTDNTTYIDPNAKENLSFRQDIAVGGDIVVTVTPIGGMLSQYYTKGKVADMKLGAIVTIPTIEYYFSNYKTGVPLGTDLVLRDSPTRLFNSYAGKIRESQYCSDLYLESPIGKDGMTPGYFHRTVSNTGPYYSDRYTLFLSAGQMSNYKFNFPDSDTYGKYDYLKDRAITQIPMICNASPR